MIEEEDFAIIRGLDPPLAFVRLVRRFRTALDAKMGTTDSSTAVAAYRLEYVNHVIAAANALDIGEFKQRPLPIGGDNDIWKTYKELTLDLDRYLVKVQIANVREPSKSTIGLEPAEKHEIRHYIEQIKTVIEASKQLDLPKKERLLDRLNDFLSEVDKDRTPLKALSDVVIELSRTGGKAAQELEPAWKWVKLIAGIFGQRQEDELAKLPKPTSPKKLEAPKKRLPPPPDGFETKSDRDNEVPF